VAAVTVTARDGTVVLTTTCILFVSAEPVATGRRTVGWAGARRFPLVALVVAAGQRAVVLARHPGLVVRAGAITADRGAILLARQGVLFVSARIVAAGCWAIIRTVRCVLVFAAGLIATIRGDILISVGVLVSVPIGIPVGVPIRGFRAAAETVVAEAVVALAARPPFVVGDAFPLFSAAHQLAGLEHGRVVAGDREAEGKEQRHV